MKFINPLAKIIKIIPQEKHYTFVHWYKRTPESNKAILEANYVVDRDEMEQYFKLAEDLQKYNSY